MAELPFRAIDADQHYYEPLDAMTRHLDPAFKDRGIQVLTKGTHTILMAGREYFRFVPNPTFDPIIVPGCLDPLFRGQIPEGVDPRSLPKVEPLPTTYRNSVDRVPVLDEQQLDKVFMFPTIGCGVEQALRFDIPATMATVSAFNRWLEDDWGFAHEDRIFTTPMLSLADPDGAVAEVEYLAANGARIVSIRPAPVPDGHGNGYSLGDARHDVVWQALVDANIGASFHLADSGYNAHIAAAWGSNPRFEAYGPIDVLGRLLVSDRAIHDTVCSLLVGGVFSRFPQLRVASVENGSDWIHLLVKRLRKQANQTPWAFAEDPLDTLRRNLWVTPYYEEDMRKLADTLGVERVLFGSDWPHGEGLSEPTDFVKELHAFSDAEIQQVMRTNALEYLGESASA